jgi:hypothetical protein
LARAAVPRFGCGNGNPADIDAQQPHTHLHLPMMQLIVAVCLDLCRSDRSAADSYICASAALLTFTFTDPGRLQARHENIYRIKQFVISLDLAEYISIGSSGMNDASASD